MRNNHTDSCLDLGTMKKNAILGPHKLNGNSMYCTLELDVCMSLLKKKTSEIDDFAAFFWITEGSQIKDLFNNLRAFNFESLSMIDEFIAKSEFGLDFFLWRKIGTMSTWFCQKSGLKSDNRRVG